MADSSSFIEPDRKPLMSNSSLMLSDSLCATQVTVGNIIYTGFLSYV